MINLRRSDDRGHTKLSGSTASTRFRLVTIMIQSTWASVI